jgi:hypothetical protein
VKPLRHVFGVVAAYLPIMRRLGPLALILLALSGCAERWVRPGSTEAEGDAANAACANEAELAVPPLLQWRIVEPSRIERDRHCFRNDRGNERCRVFERFRPARWGTVDVNEMPRQAWRRQCMASQGFTFQGYRPLRLE